MNKISNKLILQAKTKIWESMEVCKGTAIKTQMLSEFDPTENEKRFMKTWQIKMQIWEENRQNYLLDERLRYEHVNDNMYQNGTKIDRFF